MSRSIDERVVSMKFDNEQFEKNCEATMATLDKLKGSMKFEGLGKGVDNIRGEINTINRAFKNCDASPLARSVESVMNKFTALQISATTIIVDLTRSIEKLGKKTISALTVDPVKSGLQEYETQIGAIQTILANTSKNGTTLTQVNNALNELNHYADMTIYNFTQMTKNIGTFTAAGISLETSVSAIQGIANLAAVSGSTSQQASTAMYQLSQALASGTVKLMDWNSVVNAGMGGQVFQEALKKTSELLNTGAEAAIAANGSFRESLSTGWLTSQVLTETLKKFTTSGAIEYVADYCNLSKHAVQETLDSAEAQYGEADAIKYAAKALAEKSGKNEEEIRSTLQMAKTATEAATKVKTFSQLIDTTKEAAQSGWTQTWQLILGDFEEAKEMWTSISDEMQAFINGMSDKRNLLLGGALRSNFGKLEDAITKTGTSVENFEEILKKKMTEGGVDVEGLLQTYGTLAKAMQHVGDAQKYVAAAIAEFFGPITSSDSVIGETAEAINTVTTSIENLQGVVDRVIMGEFGNGTERFQRLTEAGYEYAQVQGLVNEIWERNGHNWNDTTISMEDAIEVYQTLTDEQKANIGITESQSEAMEDLCKYLEESGTSLEEVLSGIDKIGGRQYVLMGLGNIYQSILSIVQGIAEAAQEIIPKPSSEALWLFTKRFYELTVRFKENTYLADRFKRIFSGVYVLLNALGTVLKDVVVVGLKAVWFIAKPILTLIIDVFAWLGDGLTILYKLEKELQLYNQLVQFLTSTFDSAKRTIETWIDEFMQIEEVSAALDKFVDVLDRFEDSMERLITDPLQWFKDLGGWVTEGLANGIEGGMGVLGKAVELLAKFIPERFSKLMGIASPSKVMFALGGFVVAGLIAGMYAESEGMSETLIKIKDGLLKFFGDLKAGDVASFAIFMKMLDGFKLIAVAAERTSAPLEALTNMFESFGKIGESVSKSVTDMTKVFTDLAKSKTIKKAITRISKGITSVLKGIAAEFRADAFQKTMKGMKDFAISIAILVGALLVLCLIPDDRLTSAANSLILVASAMAALVWGLQRIQESSISTILNFEVNKLAAALLGIVTAMGILAVVAVLMSKLSINELVKGFGSLFVIFIFMSLIMKEACALSVVPEGTLKKANKNVSQIGTMMKRLAKAMLLMAVVVYIMGKMDPEVVVKGMFCVGLMSLYMIALGKLVTVDESGRYTQRVGSMMKRMAIAMLLMGIVVYLMGKMDPAVAIKGLLVVGTLTMFMLGLIAMVTVCGGEKGTAKVGATLIGIGIAVALMAVSVKLLGEMDHDKMWNGIKAVGYLTIIVDLMLGILAVMGDRTVKLATTMIGISIAVGIMAFTAVILGLIPTKSLWKGVAAVSALGLVYAAMIAATKNAGNLEKSAIKMAVAVAILVACVAGLAILASTSPDKLLIATGCLTAIIGMFTLMLRASKDAQACAGAAALMVLVVGALASIVIAMNQPGLKVNDAIANTVSLCMLMSSMTVCFFLLSKMKVESPGKLAKITASMLIMCVALLGVAAVLIAIGQHDINNAIESAAAISILLLAMTASFAAISAIGKFVGLQAAIQGVEAFVVFIGAMVAVIAGFSSLAYLIGDTGMEVIDNGIELFGKIGKAIGVLLGEFVGNYQASKMNAMGPALPKFGENLSDFATNLGPFLAAIKDIDMKSVAGVGILSLVFDKFLASGFFNQILSAGGKHPISDFGTDINTFYNKISPFVSWVKTIDASVITGMNGLCGALKTLSEANLNDRISKFLSFGGKSASEEFAGTLKAIGEAMVEYSQTISQGDGIDASKIYASSFAADSLSKLVEAMPRTDGVWQKLIGEKDMGEFGARLKVFGEALIGYSHAVSEEGAIDIDAIERSKKAVEPVLWIADHIQDSGVLPTILGEKNLKDFGKKMVAFGMSLLDYSSIVEDQNGPGLNAYAIEHSKQCAEKIIELSKQLTKTGLVQEIVGKQDLKEFGSSMEEFGKSMILYSTIISSGDLDLLAISRSVTAGQWLAQLANTIPDKQLLDGKVTLSSFGNEAAIYSTHLSAYSNNIKDIDMARILSSVAVGENLVYLMKLISDLNLGNTVEQFALALTTLGNTSLDAFANAMLNGQTRVHDAAARLCFVIITTIFEYESSIRGAVDSILKEILGTLNLAQWDFKRYGEASAMRFSDGINQKSYYPVRAFKSIVESCLSLVSMYGYSFYMSGGNVSKGFAEGISDNAWRVMNASRSMAQLAIDTTNDVESIHSPSRVFKDIGMYTAMGFAKGIDEYSSLVSDSSIKMATNVIDNAEYVMSTLSDVVGGNIDSAPSIRPVVDMTDINGRSFNFQSSLNTFLSKPVDSLSKIVSDAQERINNSNAEVVNAIASLHDDMNSFYSDDGSEVALYVDGRKLASSIARPMNRQLNILSKRGAY